MKGLACGVIRCFAGPELDVSIRAMTTATQLRALQEGEIDGGLVRSVARGVG